MSLRPDNPAKHFQNSLRQKDNKFDRAIHESDSLLSQARAKDDWLRKRQRDEEKHERVVTLLKNFDQRSLKSPALESDPLFTQLKTKMSEFNVEVKEAKREPAIQSDEHPDNVHYRVALHSGLKVLLKEVVQEKDRAL